MLVSWKSLAFTVAGLAISISCPGCIVPIPTGKVYVEKPDPLHDQMLKVQDVHGTTVKLSDGREAQLAGVSIEGLDENEKHEFESHLRSYTGASLVLVEPLGQKVRLVSPGLRRRRPDTMVPI